MINQSKGIRKQFPYRNHNITLILIAMNIFVYFITYLMPVLVDSLELSPVGFLYHKYYWTPVSYMFVHGGMTHIIFNMLGLFFFGPQVENRMGSWEFLTFYMLSGIFSGIISLGIYFLLGVNAHMVGASGAIYAVLLAYAVYYPNAIVYLLFVIPIKTKVMVLLFTAIELFQGVFNSSSGIGHFAHLAGFAVAFVYFIVRIGLNPITAFKDSGKSHWH